MSIRNFVFDKLIQKINSIFIQKTYAPLQKSRGSLLPFNLFYPVYSSATLLR